MTPGSDTKIEIMYGTEREQVSTVYKAASFFPFQKYKKLTVYPVLSFLKSALAYTKISMTEAISRRTSHNSE